MQSLGTTDAIGFLAAILTLATFAQSSMSAMRATAIAANLCFISYGILGGFVPIIVLHTLLLPINIVRLRQLWRPDDAAALRRDPPPTTPEARPGVLALSAAEGTGS